MNEVLAGLPGHLLDLVIDQPYNEYTARDHALWRYVMRQNVRYLSKVAHGSYTEGLQKTGISIEQIPHMYGMNRILKEIGWAAVAVDGFIPPAAFMEFQAYNVLVIAADIRPIGQIEYTPAPDIIHEAAGHAPIIADSEYADYLRLFGEIGSKAFSSGDNHRLYEAVRHLSILKTDPYTPAGEIAQAEAALKHIESNLGPASEMSLIRNLHWWTVEYGLIGDLHKPAIYGAGLLSSIGESKHALSGEVKKLPYSLDAMNVGFDITSMQPQLFVTPDFEHLTKVLREFELGMAVKKGGLEGLRKAIDSGSDATAVYSSGLAVSGIFTGVLEQDGKPVYLQTTGPTTLNYHNRQLNGHGKEQHAHGFGAPVGALKGIDKAPEHLSEADLKEMGMRNDSRCSMVFESGVEVCGILTAVTRKEGRLLLMSFRDCLVNLGDKVLFEPGWGIYDMAIGEHIVSCYNGPADPGAYGLRFPVPHEKTHKVVHDAKSKDLFRLYAGVRQIRESSYSAKKLESILEELQSGYREDWLLSLEIYELSVREGDHALAQKADRYLAFLTDTQPEVAHLIRQAR